jgi:hypothetical protein
LHVFAAAGGGGGVGHALGLFDGPGQVFVVVVVAINRDKAGKLHPLAGRLTAMTIIIIMFISIAGQAEGLLHGILHGFLEVGLELGLRKGFFQVSVELSVVLLTVIIAHDSL